MTQPASDTTLAMARSMADLFPLIGQLIARIDAAEGEIETFRSLDTCMCGGSMDHSPWEGHTPVSMYHYERDQLLKENARLTACLAATQATA